MEEIYGVRWNTKIKEDIFTNHAKSLPYLKYNKTINGSSKGLSDIAIIGENFDALRTLMVSHEKSFDFIYIDPPYNTGNSEGEFMYNDKRVNKEDGYRHSKWLSFMRNRLWIAKLLLTDNGVIAISIDDNEFAQLKLLMDGIFGEENGKIIVWKKKSNASNTETQIGTITEYILIYKKSRSFNAYSKIEKLRDKIDGKDDNGEYILEYFTKTNKGAYFRPTMVFDIINPKTGKVYKLKDGVRWTFGKEAALEKIKSGEIVFNDDKKSVKRKRYLKDGFKKVNDINLWENLGSLKSAKKELEKIFGKKEMFSTPKPSELILKLVHHFTTSESKVLDFFAGSGTTLQATRTMNAFDNGNRKCFLITNSENNIDKLMLERVSNLDKLGDVKRKIVLGVNKVSKKYYDSKILTPTEEEFYKRSEQQGCECTFDYKIGLHTAFIENKVKLSNPKINVFNVESFKLENEYSLADIVDDRIMEEITETMLLTFDDLSVDIENKHYKIFNTEYGTVALMKNDNDIILMELANKKVKIIIKPSRTADENQEIMQSTVITIPHKQILNMKKIGGFINDKKEI